MNAAAVSDDAVRTPRTVLVRWATILRDDRPAGNFRAHALGGGRIPAWSYRSFGTYCADTSDKVFALTYDDGPDPATTPGVLDVLKRYGARATFFVLSDAAQRHPEIIRRMVSEGHEVALHGADHRSLLTLSTAAAAQTIERARDAVAHIAARPVALYRPPYGEHTLAQARAIRRLGMRMTLWSGVAYDWIDGPEATIADAALAQVFPGAVILLHDTRADPEALGEGERLPAFDRGAVLERILSRTRADGYAERTASELFDRYPFVQSMNRERMRRT